VATSFDPRKDQQPRTKQTRPDGNGSRYQPRWRVGGPLCPRRAGPGRSDEGSTAPVCAGRIHTDFQCGFIRAELIRWDALLDIGSWNKAKDLGKIRLEGKDHPVADGNVVESRFIIWRLTLPGRYGLPSRCRTRTQSASIRAQFLSRTIGKKAAIS
jgi:hypothetical protein